MSFEGNQIKLQIGARKYTQSHSGTWGHEIYQVLRTTVEEVLFDVGRRINSLTVLVPANFISIDEGKIHCEDQFVEIINGAIEGLGFRETRFLAQILELGQSVKPMTRALGCTFIYVGNSATTIATLVSDGMSAIYTTPIGYAHLVNDLVVVKKIDEAVARRLLKLAVVTLEPSPKDNYTFECMGKDWAFPVSAVNDIIKSRLEELAEELSDHIVQQPVILFGPEFNRVHGARNYLGQILGMNVKSA